MFWIEFRLMFSSHVSLPVSRCGKLLLTIETVVGLELAMDPVDMSPNLSVSVATTETLAT